jgi:hypothetical protein
MEEPAKLRIERRSNSVRNYKSFKGFSPAARKKQGPVGFPLRSRQELRPLILALIPEEFAGLV